MITPRSALKFELFAEASRQRKIDEVDDPLQAIAQHIDFSALAGLVDGIIERGDGSKGGRSAYPTEVMVRVLVLKRLYNLSDEQMEYQLLDRRSYQRFCLLQDSMNVPDRNTIGRFGERLGVDGATALLQGVDAQLHRHGYMARGGQAIDATLVPAPRQQIGKDDRKKLGEGQTPATGTASEHDGHHFDEVLDPHNSSKQVTADKGYPSKQRSQMLKALGFKDDIQRKAQKDKPLSERQKCRNQRIAKKRAKVEHVFAGIRHMGGKFVRCIGQARASATMTMMTTCYNIKRLASFLARDIDPFFKPAPSKRQVRLQRAKA